MYNHQRRRKAAGMMRIDAATEQPSHPRDALPSPPDSKKSRSSTRFWSSLVRAKTFLQQRHHNNSDISSTTTGTGGGGGDTLLPTTYNSKMMMASPRRTTTTTTTRTGHRPKSGGGNRSRRGTTNNNLCSSVMSNSFLMGGVDKRRYRKKPRRGLAYRIFWSSLPRRLGVGFVSLYIAVYHVLVPLGSLMVDRMTTTTAGTGRGGSASSSLSSLVHSPRFDGLPSVKQEWAALERLNAARDELRLRGGTTRGGDGGVVMRIPSVPEQLEAIAPAWFHRFDSSSPGEEEEEDAADRAAGDAVAVGGGAVDDGRRKKRRYHRPVVSHGEDDHHRRRLLEVTGGIADGVEEDRDTDDAPWRLPLRNLQTMEVLGASYSSCGGIDDDGGGTTTTTVRAATTLVVQTSIDRMWILGETCAHRWTTDPIVAVVFVPDATTFEEERGDDAVPEREALTRTLERQADGLLRACPNLTLVRYRADGIETLKGRYPVNRLRNVGLDLVRTTHVLVADVDFVPSRDLERIVRERVVEAEEASKRERRRRTAVVVPAFEKKPPRGCDGSDLPAVDCMASHLKNDSAFLPRTFDELTKCYLDEEDCEVFQSKVNWDGHSTTRSDRWIRKRWFDDTDGGDATDTDGDGDDHRSFRTIPCFDTPRYEPYVVLEWCPSSSSGDSNGNSPLAPYYDERFYGYGKNKIELVSHLRKSAYRFEILPEGFLIHNPHPESKTKEVWLGDGGGGAASDLHATMDALYRHFLDELESVYRSVHDDTTKLCPRQPKPL